MADTSTHILIVEDETIVALDIRRAVSKLGYSVAGVAAEGSEALRIAAERRPGLVLMDIRLRGDMDGIATARALRDRHDVPVVYLTASTDEETLRRALASGPFAYVLKPFKDTELQCAIELGLHKHGTESALRARDRQLAGAVARFEAMLQVAAAGIALEDESERIWRVNPQLCAMFGIAAEPAELVGGDAAALHREMGRHFRDPEHFAERTEQVARERRPVISEALRLADGRSLERNFIPVFVREQFLGQFWAYRDVSEREGLIQKLERQAETLRGMALEDELTGLYNRRGFMALAYQQLRIADRRGDTAVLFVIDLDHFKRINDEFGHEGGDQALRDTAQLLRNTFRDSDLVARLGGDEFVVLALMSDADHANELKARLHTALLDLNSLRNVAGAYEIALSVGALVRTHGDTRPLDELLARADEAMYAEKRVRRELRAEQPSED